MQVWRAEFPCSKRVEGCIKGYRRVFYQGSTDHRGTPGAPGRTVTLEHSPEHAVYGAAYLLSGTAEEQQSTLKDLEWREKQYDVRERVPVFAAAEDVLPIIPSALVYIASPNLAANENYLGPAPPEDIARQIATARGPSGPNSEYLFRLAQAVRQTGHIDEELMWLDTRVKELLKEQASSKESGAGRE